MIDWPPLSLFVNGVRIFEGRYLPDTYAIHPPLSLWDWRPDPSCLFLSPLNICRLRFDLWMMSEERRLRGRN